MRKNTAKQSEASRANGSTSHGPKSAEGKEKVQFNARKDGLYSKDLVIESLGERQEVLDNRENEVSDFFGPENIIEESLSKDYVYNEWWRERVRRAASAELKNRLQPFWTRDMADRLEELESLKAKFNFLVDNLKAAGKTNPPLDKREILAELEETRKRLASTSFGLAYLIGEMKQIEEEAASRGQLSAHSELLISACCGFGNEQATLCLSQNELNKREAKREAEEKSKQKQTTGEKPETEAPIRKEACAEELKEQEKERRSRKKNRKLWEILDADPKSSLTTMLTLLIRDATQSLIYRRQLLESAEKLEGETRMAAAILPPDNSFERFLRAETTYDRRMHRDLGTLLAMKQAKMPPEPLSVCDSGANRSEVRRKKHKITKRTRESRSGDAKYLWE